MKALYVIPYLIVVALSAYYVCDMYLSNMQSEGFHGDNLEKAEFTSKIKNMTLPKHYESLFYRADMKPAIREALRGSPFNYLPEYRNPCWMSRTDQSKSWNRNRKERLRCLPLVHIVGFAKSGTSDLYESLGTHPDVRSVMQEPLFWTLGRFAPTRYLPAKHTVENYIKQYDNIAEECRYSVEVAHKETVCSKIIQDASSTKIFYLDDWRKVPGHEHLDEPKYTVAMTMKALIPQAKIIIIMRNPVDRTYSRFRMNCGKCQPELFHEFAVGFVAEMQICLRHQTLRGCAYNYTLFPTRMTRGAEQNSLFIRGSLYYVYVRDWLDVFPRDQVHFVHAESYYDDRANSTNTMFRFLELDPHKITKKRWDSMNDRPVTNNGTERGRMAKPMLNKTRMLLTAFFRPYNILLAELLNDDRFRWES